MPSPGRSSASSRSSSIGSPKCMKRPPLQVPTATCPGSRMDVRVDRSRARQAPGRRGRRSRSTPAQVLVHGLVAHARLPVGVRLGDHPLDPLDLLGHRAAQRAPRVASPRSGGTRAARGGRGRWARRRRRSPPRSAPPAAARRGRRGRTRPAPRPRTSRSPPAAGSRAGSAAASPASAGSPPSPPRSRSPSRALASFCASSRESSSGAPQPASSAARPPPRRSRTTPRCAAPARSACARRSPTRRCPRTGARAPTRCPRCPRAPRACRPRTPSGTRPP